jgi:hypothetical protein
MAWVTLHPLLVLSPAIAKPIGAGWSKNDVRSYLAERTLMSADVAERSIRADGGEFSFAEWVNAGRLPSRCAASDSPSRRVPAVVDAASIQIVVAGNPHRNHAIGYLQHGGYGSPVSREIRWPLCLMTASPPGAVTGRG